MKKGEKMARKRMIDPSIWTNEHLGECSVFERLLYIGLISQADDEGRGKANAKWLRAVLLPYDDTEPGEVTSALLSLSRHGLIVLYSVEGCQYYAFPNWQQWQVINKPTLSKIPAPGVLPEYYGSTTGVLPEYYGSTTGALPPNRIERNIIERNREGENAHARAREISKYGTFKNVELSEGDMALLSKSIPSESVLVSYIERLSCYLSQTGKQYASHAAAILKWYQEDNGPSGGSYANVHAMSAEDFAQDYTDIFSEVAKSEK